jgi:cell division protein FtsQ
VRTERTDLFSHLPSWRVLALGFGAVAAAGLAYLAARETPMFALRSVDVSGASPAVAARVESALRGFTGTSLVALNMNRVDERLEALPEIAGATYDRDFPHTLRVSVRVDPPVAVLRHGLDAWLVSARARVLDRLASPLRSPLPRVWLGGDEDVVRGETLGDVYVLRAVRTLAVMRRTRFSTATRMVKSSDDELTVVLASGVELRLGDQVALWLKLAVVRRVLPMLARAGGLHYLDVSVPERPVSA